MTEAEWDRCTDPLRMLASLRGRASDRKLRLFACAAWRWRYTRSAPLLLRWTFLRMLLAPLRKTERAADHGGDFTRRWWGAFTFAAPEASRAALDTVHTFRDGFLGMFDWSAERVVLCQFLRDIFGPSPFRPVVVAPPLLKWNGTTIVQLAKAFYADRRFEDMPVLADALEEAGCQDQNILRHCREAGLVHVRGCWLLDLLLKKE